MNPGTVDGFNAGKGCAVVIRTSPRTLGRSPRARLAVTMVKARS